MSNPFWAGEVAPEGIVECDLLVNKHATPREYGRYCNAVGRLQREFAHTLEAETRLLNSAILQLRKALFAQTISPDFYRQRTAQLRAEFNRQGARACGQYINRVRIITAAHLPQSPGSTPAGRSDSTPTGESS